MNIVCLDMEGVLVPEIWIAFAEESGIPELRRTTRDEPDYDKLMRWRIDILRQHGLGLTDIQNTIRRIDPLPGAREFLDRLRTKAQVVILSDTFEQFGLPLMEKLNCRYGMRRWVTVNGCVCLVQFLHDLQCHSSCLHRQLDQFFHRQLIVGDCRQSLNIKIIHRITVISQFPCLVSIGTDPFQTIDHQLTKRTDIFIQILVIHNTGNL